MKSDWLRFSVRPLITAIYNCRHSPTRQNVRRMVHSCAILLLQITFFIIPLCILFIVFSPILAIIFAILVLFDFPGGEDESCNPSHLSPREYDRALEEQTAYLQARLGFVPNCPLTITDADIVAYKNIQEDIRTGKLVPADQTQYKTPWEPLLTADVRQVLRAWLEQNNIIRYDHCTNSAYGPVKHDFFETLNSDKGVEFVLFALGHRLAPPAFRAFLLTDASRIQGLQQAIEKALLSGAYSYHEIVTAQLTVASSGHST